MEEDTAMKAGSTAENPIVIDDDNDSDDDAATSHSTEREMPELELASTLARTGAASTVAASTAAENMTYFTQECRKYLKRLRGEIKKEITLRTYDPTKGNGLLDCFQRFWSTEATPPINNGLKQGRQHNLESSGHPFRAGMTIPQKIGLWSLWGDDVRHPNIYMEWQYTNCKYSHRFYIKFLIDKDDALVESRYDKDRVTAGPTYRPHEAEYHRKDITDQLQSVEIYYPKSTETPQKITSDGRAIGRAGWDTGVFDEEEDIFKDGHNRRILMHSTVYPPKQDVGIYRPSVKSLIAARILLGVALAQNLNNQYQITGTDKSIDYILMCIEDQAKFGKKPNLKSWSEITSMAGYGSFYAWHLYSGEMKLIDSNWKYVASSESLVKRLIESNAIKDCTYKQEKNEEFMYTAFYDEASKNETLMRKIEEYRKMNIQPEFQKQAPPPIFYFDLQSKFMEIIRIARDIVIEQRFKPSVFEEPQIYFLLTLNDVGSFKLDPIKREMKQWLRKPSSLRM